MDDTTPRNLPTGATRKRLKCGITKLKDLLHSGQLKAVVADRRILVTVASIEAYEASLPAFVPGVTNLAPLHPVKRKIKRARRAP